VLKISPLPDDARMITRDHVYRLLRQSIVNGMITSGERLVEEEIAETMNVSRTPVREALRRLESDGLIVREGRGRVVAVSITDQDKRDLNLLRVAIDQVVARLACERAAPADWAEVRRYLAPLAEAVTRHGMESQQYASIHLELHMAINRVAFASQRARHLGSHPFLYLGALSDDYVQQATTDPVQQHRDLIAVLASGDTDRAVAAVTEHARRGGTPAQHGEEGQA
jgi:DNA-binding GntR family transcriptional regulator